MRRPCDDRATAARNMFFLKRQSSRRLFLLHRATTVRRPCDDRARHLFFEAPELPTSLFACAYKATTARNRFSHIKQLENIDGATTVRRPCNDRATTVRRSCDDLATAARTIFFEAPELPTSISAFAYKVTTARNMFSLIKQLEHIEGATTVRRPCDDRATTVRRPCDDRAQHILFEATKKRQSSRRLCLLAPRKRRPRATGFRI
jgi:hypothetical protein